MAITDEPAPLPAKNASDGARELRQTYKFMINNVENNLTKIRSIVKLYGRANLATELSPDGAQMLSIYNNLKAALEAAPLSKTIPVLPS